MRKGIFAALLLLSISARAATISVTTLQDVSVVNDGQCTLREAIIAANMDDVGNSGCVAQGTFTGNDTVSLVGLSGSMLISSTLVAGGGLILQGPPQGGLSIEAAASGYRILNLAGGAIFVRDLTFANALGGALNVQAATIAVIERSRFINNAAGGAESGGAIQSTGASLVDVSDSYFEGNSGRSGGAIYVDGTNAGLTVDNTTFFNNSASFVGGAVSVRQGQNVQLTNVTLTANSAVSSGSALRFGTGADAPDVRISYATVAGNTGAAQIVASNSAAVTIERSILASASNNCNTGSGATIAIDSLSIDEAGTCGGGVGAQLNPLLGTLADNGGDVPTMRLQPGSPAIDRAADCGFISQDARGQIRPSEGDGVEPAQCDIGAFEVQGANVFVSVSGLAGSGLVAQLGSQSPRPVSSNGQTYIGSLLAGQAYTVTFPGQPVGPVQQCSASNGSGTAQSTDITVQVSCSTVDFPVGGTVSGLTGTGLSLELNGAESLAIANNGAFTFLTGIEDLQSYLVTVDNQPINPQQVCIVSNGAGSVTGQGVTNVELACQNTIDLTITKDDGQAFFTPGQPLSYLIVVSNNSVDTVTDARVVDTLPAALVSGAWICTPGQGASCTASGTGNIDDLVELGPGSSLVFTLTAATASTFRGVVANTAEVIAPMGAIDSDLNNNLALDESATGQVFADSFEDVAANIARRIEALTR